MQMCLYDPSKMSKWHFVPRGGTMSYLEFSLLNKEGDIFQLSYCSIGIFFLGGGTFMVKW